MSSPVAAELLALLCCPETRQSLTPAPAEVVTRLEALRAAGALRDRGGNLYDAPVVAGLVRQDGRVFYPIRDGIPALVPDSAFDIPFST